MVRHRGIPLLLTIRLLLTFVLSKAPLDQVAIRFRDQEEPKPSLRHLVCHYQTGHIYAAGRNVLYHFDSNLTLLQKVRNGPHKDSPFCNFNGDCIRPNRQSQDVMRTMTNNYNQVLLVDDHRGWLIVCGTLYQGICSVLRLDDITQVVHGYDSSSVPVAANLANSSTAAFLGPSEKHSQQTVLYIAASFTYDAYREHLPSVCSRSLEVNRIFQLVDPGDIAGQSGMLLKNDHRADFPIRYVGGFVDSDHAYWLAVQRQTLDRLSPLRTRMLRVCIADRRFESYSEVPLECLGADNSNYNVLTAFHYSLTGGYFVGLFERSPFQSAICLFTMTDIRSAFSYNLQRCNSGIDTWNLPHYGLNQRCHNVTGSSQPPNGCPKIRVGGTIPATKIAMKTYDGQRLASVTVDKLDSGQTVLLVGTEEGKLKKLLLESTDRAREYEEAVVASGPIKADTVFDKDRHHVYMMTESEVVKVKVHSCSNHSNCTACLQSGDPYCGWCTLANKCSIKSECSTAGEEGAFSFAGYGHCPQIDWLKPASVSIQEVQAEITLQALNLPAPALREEYKCIFDKARVPAVRDAGDRFTCGLPKREHRPQIPSSQDSTVTTLKIWSSRSGQSIVQTNFTFYDCAVHKTCTECVQSRWKCDWCLADSLCVPSSDACSNQVRISHTEQQWRIPSLMHENSYDSAAHTALLSNSCPHIDSTSQFEVLLPENNPTAITVPVVNVDRLALNGVDKRVICLVNVEGHEVRVRATLSENQKAVVCEEYAYSYDSRLPSISAELYLQTNKGTMIDKVKVMLYKCQLMASDCSRCLNLDPRFECAWCDNGCEHRYQCSSGPLDHYPQSLSVCPPAVIDQFYPTSGPIEGGTRVEITGRDLGMRQTDVDGRVTVAGVPCTIAEYYTSERVICITERSTHGPVSGPVEVRLDNGRQGRSQSEFRFVEPKVTGFHPNLGPRAGGTRLIISGQHLTQASSIEVFVDAVRCVVQLEKSNPRMLVCLTSESVKANTVANRVTLRLDMATRIIPGPFTYTPDPEITSISPSTTFASGGRLLTVRGTNLHSIQRPLMYLLNRNGLIQSEVSICRVINAEKMYCPSPAMLFAHGRSKRDLTVDEASSSAWVIRDDLKLINSQRYDIGFLMDDVQTVRHLSPAFGMIVVPDPFYQPFPDGYKLYQDGPLIIEGNNLNFGSSIRDIQMTIGGRPCNVTLLASTQLVCQPPKMGKEHSGKEAEADSEVQIRVGNLHFELGSLRRQDKTASSDSSMALLGGIVGVTCSLLLLLMVATVFWWRKKSWLAERRRDEFGSLPVGRRNDPLLENSSKLEILNELNKYEVLFD